VYAIVINNAAALQKKVKDECELVHKMPGIFVCVCVCVCVSDIP